MEDCSMNSKIVNGVKCFLYLFGLLGVALSAQGASFDCGKAQSKVEHLICDNPEISKLDDELSSAYKTALQDKAKADAIKRGQKQWMKERNGCTDAACVRRAYETRLSGLSSVPDKPLSKPKQNLRFSVTEGKGWSVCESYTKYLNTLPESEPLPLCHLKLSPDFPDLKQPDWEEMDIPTHLELVYSIEKILSPSYHDRPIDTFEHWKTVYDQQIHNGEASPRLRRVRLALVEGGQVETILAYEPDRNACDKWIKKMKYVDANRTSLFIWNEQVQKIEVYTSHITFGIPQDLMIFQGRALTFTSAWETGFVTDKNVAGYFDVKHFSTATGDSDPYVNLHRCKIGFEMPRESYERMMK